MQRALGFERRQNTDNFSSTSAHSSPIAALCTGYESGVGNSITANCIIFYKLIYAIKRDLICY